MNCPYCEAKDNFITIDTRLKTWGVKRIKKCLQCEEKFPTIEIYNISDEALNSLRKSKMIRRHKRSK